MTKILLTPGPLTTHSSVRQAMMDDYGSRDSDFTDMVQQCRIALSALALEGSESHAQNYPTTLLQGSGTFALEAMLTSFVGHDNHLLLMANGSYGHRLITIAERLALPHSTLISDEDKPLAPEQLEDYLTHNSHITHLAFVHCETSSAVRNPLTELAAIAQRHNVHTLIDAMSSFAIEPLNMHRQHITALAASSNKGLEGVPGIAFVIAARAALEACAAPPSLVLNLKEQHELLERKQQFRFTPPVQVVAALQHALHRLHKEGGRAKRFERYQQNCQQLRRGMEELGYRPFLKEKWQSPMIVAFHYRHDQFDFDDFYRHLKAQGFLIYHGASAHKDCFRVGCIGAITKDDMARFLRAVKDYQN